MLADIISVEVGNLGTILGWVVAVLCLILFLLTVATSRSPAEGGLAAIPMFIGCIILACISIALIMQTWAPVIIVGLLMIVLLMVGSRR
jgi:hypothetical protein